MKRGKSNYSLHRYADGEMRACSQRACSLSTVSKLTGYTRTLICLLGLTSGCITHNQNSAATQPATSFDTKIAQTAYWMDKPAITQVSSGDFDKLWNACATSLREHSFIIDRTDLRGGVMTSLARPSKQIYEFWRNDVVDPHDLEQSTLGTMRRTVRIDVRKGDGGTFTAAPKVVIERYSMLEKRITSVAQYRDVFSLTSRDLKLDAEQQDQSAVSSEFWYATGRDSALEKSIAESIRRNLK